MVWICAEEEQRTLNMVLPCRRKKGRPHRRFMDVVKEGMQRAGVTKKKT